MRSTRIILRKPSFYQPAFRYINCRFLENFKFLGIHYDDFARRITLRFDRCYEKIQQEMIQWSQQNARLIR